MKSRRTRVHRARVAVAIQQLVAIAGEGSSGGDESEADGPPRKRRRRERKQVARCGRVCAEEAGDDWRNLSHFVSFCAVVWCATQQAHGAGSGAPTASHMPSVTSDGPSEREINLNVRYPGGATPRVRPRY